MSRMMNFIAAQAWYFFQPIVAAIVDPTRYRVFAEFLERRESIEYMTRRIEEMEAAREARKT